MFVTKSSQMVIFSGNTCSALTRYTNYLLLLDGYGHRGWVGREPCPYRQIEARMR